MLVKGLPSDVTIFPSLYFGFTSYGLVEYACNPHLTTYFFILSPVPRIQSPLHLRLLFFSCIFFSVICYLS